MALAPAGLGPFELYGGAGWATTALSVDSKDGSVLSGSGPDFETTAESFADYNISLGALLRAHLGDVLFVGMEYLLLYGHTELDNQAFYNTVVDAVMDYYVNDIVVRAGATFDFITFWGGLGFVVYVSDVDLDERSGPDRWDITFDQGDNFFKGEIGVSAHPGDLVSLTAQFDFIPDPTIKLVLALSF